MSSIFSNTLRRLGIASSVSYVILSLLYVATLAIGLLLLPSQDDPIGDPMLTIIEMLIIPIMVAGIVLMSVIYAWASPEKRPFGMDLPAFNRHWLMVQNSVQTGPGFCIPVRNGIVAGCKRLRCIRRWPAVLLAGYGNRGDE